jgi:hypothetical protein
MSNQQQQLVDVSDFYPTDCVLCGEEFESHEAYEQHMEDDH